MTHVWRSWGPVRLLSALVLMLSVLVIGQPADAMAGEPTVGADLATPGEQQELTISGDGWAPGLPVFILPCPDAASIGDVGDPGDDCDTDDLTPTTIRGDGTLSAVVDWFVPAEGLVFAVGDAGRTQTVIGKVETADGPNLYSEVAEPNQQQLLAISGDGWTPGLAIFVLPCPGAESAADVSGHSCDSSQLTPATVSAKGTFETTVDWFVPTDGLYFLAGDAAQTQSAIGFVLTEADFSRPELRATVEAPGLQRVAIYGSDWIPGTAIFILPCPGVTDERDATGDACDTRNLTPATVREDGTFEVAVEWDVPPAGLVFAAGDAAASQGAAGTVTVEPLRWRTDAELSLHEARPASGLRTTVDYRNTDGSGLPARLVRLAVVASNKATSTTAVEVRYRMRCFDADGNVVAKRGKRITVQPGKTFKRRLNVRGASYCTTVVRALSADAFDGDATVKIRSRRTGV